MSAIPSPDGYFQLLCYLQGLPAAHSFVGVTLLQLFFLVEVQFKITLRSSILGVSIWWEEIIHPWFTFSRSKSSLPMQPSLFPLPTPTGLIFFHLEWKHYYLCPPNSRSNSLSRPLEAVSPTWLTVKEMHTLIFLGWACVTHREPSLYSPHCRLLPPLNSSELQESSLYNGDNHIINFQECGENYMRLHETVLWKS